MRFGHFEIKCLINLGVEKLGQIMCRNRRFVCTLKVGMCTYLGRCMHFISNFRGTFNEQKRLNSHKLSRTYQSAPSTRHPSCTSPCQHTIYIFILSRLLYIITKQLTLPPNIVQLVAYWLGTGEVPGQILARARIFSMKISN